MVRFRSAEGFSSSRGGIGLVCEYRFGAGLGGVLLRCLALCWGDGIEVRFLLALELVGIGPDDRWTVLRTGSLAVKAGGLVSWVSAWSFRVLRWGLAHPT